MLFELTRKYREHFQVLDMCHRWDSGKELKWIDGPVFSMWDYPIAFIKGDRSSRMFRDHTSIHLTEFTEFAKTCSGKVCIVNSRLHSDREIIIGFDDEDDAVMFKLRWA